MSAQALRELLWAAIGLSGYQSASVATVLIVIVAILGIWLFGRPWLEKQFKQKWGPLKWTETAPRIVASILTTIILVVPTIPNVFDIQQMNQGQTVPPQVDGKGKVAPQREPQPRETIAAVLIRKYTVLPTVIVAPPDRFIPTWIQRINSVRIDREKRHLRPDLQRLIREIGRPPSHGLTVKEFVDDAVGEATFTLRCLASEGYIQITETTAEGMWYAVGFPNLEFEFVPVRLNEFIEGL
jgi:hypothetical protein